MQHSSQTHSWPHGQHVVPSAPVQPVDASQSRLGSPSSPQVSPHQSPNPHGRRLQLRNARFTASSVPPRRISPILGLVAGPVETLSRLQDSERSPPSIEKRSLYGESLPPSPVNILQEIQNSARRRKTSPKGGFGSIFEDSPSMDENTRPLDDDEMSWYEERSNECTPSGPRAAASMLGLREGSLNQKSQSLLNSPLAKQSRGRARAHSSFSADAVEQSRYIEHLESQLASAQAKIDGFTSPKANKLRSAKLRSLTNENRNLAKDNAEWAKRAKEMVQEEKKRFANLEVEMRTLEEDLEIKDARIAEFEWELEAMRTQVKEAEGLEEANANLEKKIDMLSCLLVNSPNKTGARSAATSPKKMFAQVSPGKRNPRPISMLSRVSSSPNAARISLASASETAFWDSRSRSTSILEAQEDPSSDHCVAQIQYPTSDLDNTSPDSSKRFSFSDSYDDRRNSTSFTTRTGPSSRPTSFMSTSSMGVPTWGVPMQHDGDSKYSNRQRKMRKFPSGSNSLKPLILPVASNANPQSLPASAPIYPSIDTVAYRDVSASSSIDPTTSFLTNTGDNYPFSTPTTLSRPRSTTLAREETMNALEGKRPGCRTVETEFDGATCVASGSTPEAGSISTGLRQYRRSKPRSLQTELEQANAEHASLNALGISTDDARDNGFLSSVIRSSTYADPTRLPHNDTTPQALPRNSETLSPNTSKTLKAHETIVFTPTPDHPRSLFARITSLITQTKQDPFDLARRVLANAWTLGCANLGGLAWWLLGPLHHQQRCRLLEGNRVPGCPETSSRPGDRNRSWQHFSAEIRNGRLVDSGYASGCAGTWNMPYSQQSSHCQSEPQHGSSTWRSQPHLFPCDDCVEPSSKRTIRVWFQFTLTVVLAVGLAVKYGPGLLLAELSENGHTVECPRPGKNDAQLDQEHQDDCSPLHDDEDETVKFDAVVATRNMMPFSPADTSHEAKSSYGNIAFAEVLRPADFEAG